MSWENKTIVTQVSLTNLTQAKNYIMDPNKSNSSFIYLWVGKILAATKKLGIHPKAPLEILELKVPKLAQLSKTI